jgi:hypothetical protein
MSGRIGKINAFSARLAACLHRVGCLPSAALTQAVTDEVYAFVQGAPQSDDLTMLALRYLGSHRGSVCTDAVSL